MSLAPISSVDPSALRWTRTGEKPAAYSLRAGDTEIATLSWDRPSGSLATGTTSDGAWRLKRAGFLQPTILVRRAADETIVARLSAHLARHEIAVSGGATYRLRHASHLLPAWTLTDGRGTEVFHLEPVAERHALSGGAVVGSRVLPDLGLLLVLTWYFVVLSWLEDETIDALAPFQGPDPPLER
jgi:hypothetical protein